MANSPTAADLSELLAPVPGEEPAGTSLRYDAVYPAIEEARREDDPTLPQGDWERPLKRSDWPQVERLCTDALTQRSKDLQLAAWLAESWLHRRGLQGLSDGLALVVGLCTQYWDTVHPRIEDGDVDYRTAPFVWINENLAFAVRITVPLAEDQSADDRKLTLADWEEALRVENLSRHDSDVAASAEKAKKITRNAFLTSVSLTPAGAFAELLGQIANCSEAVTALERMLDDRLGPDSPGLGRLRDTLESMRKAIREFGGEPKPKTKRDEKRAFARPTAGSRAMPLVQKQENTMSDETPDPGQDGSAPSGPIRSREEAYRRLSEAADYLLRTEPHSPSPYLVMRAVTWGRMPLTDLLQELVQSEGDLAQLYTLLGMRQGPLPHRAEAEAYPQEESED